jgi:homoserine kinase
MIIKPGLAVAAVALSAVTIAGCGSTSPSGSRSASPAGGQAAATSSTAASSAAASPTPSVNPGGTIVSASPGGSGAGGSGAAAAGTECTAAHLAIAYTDNKQIRQGALAGMSHADNVVTFTNTGSATCRIQGYPGMAALNAAGKQIQQAARASVGKIPLVILAPGQVASAEITGNTASCTKPASVPGLLVTAPDQRTSTRLGPYGTVCVNSLGIGPVHPGNSAGLKL